MKTKKRKEVTITGIRSGENSSYLVGHFQNWYLNGKWKGIEIKDENRLKYMDFILENKGIYLGQIHGEFYGIIGEEKMFDLFSYSFEGTTIVSGEKKKNLEGRAKFNQDIPSRIVRVIARRKSKIKKIAKIFEFPLK